MGAQEENRRIANVFIWLLTRASFYDQAARDDAILLNSQQWRNFFQLTHQYDDQNPSKQAASRDTLRELLHGVLSPARLDRLGKGGAVIPPDATAAWKTTKYKRDDRIFPAHLHDIVWELAETAFRHELFLLDKAASSLSLTPAERLDRILDCFTEPSLIPRSIPLQNTGLVSRDWRVRKNFLLPFLRIMSHWPSLPPILSLNREEQNGDFPLNRYKELELSATKFYCQTFYNHFGRAASLPRRRWGEPPNCEYI